MHSKKRKILVIDDDSRILRLIKRFLEKNGFDVTTTPFPNDALKLIYEAEFDVIVLDVMMPQITGIEFAKQIKFMTNKPAIIVLTALSTTKCMRDAEESGVNEFITKPFDPHKLLKCINNLLIH